LHSILRIASQNMSTKDLINLIQSETLNKEIPSFKAGDTVNVHVRIVEGNKERIQQYQGVVIARSGVGATQTFMVRKVSNGTGVERIFPLFSPNIDKIEVLKRGAVRRAKLFYLRGLSGKSARIKERIVKSTK
jgi:large subunit ribosomal protein L19